MAQHKTTAKGHADYRELLARKDVDAVIIATTPHWHALIAIDAVEAGKDIYLQKPMTLYPDETLAVRNAVNQHKRISQIGTQIHASENYRRVVEWIRSGKLGPVGVVRTFNVMNQGPNGIGHAPKMDAPADLDWQRWLGPAPVIAYNALLAAGAYNHCSFFDFGRGKPARRIGTYFHAQNATLYNDYGMHKIVAEGKLLADSAAPEKSIASSPGHEREWLDSVKTRKEPSCSVNYHYKVDLALTLANLSYRLGRSVRFDPKTEKIIGDDKAVRLARPEYRAPWKFPVKYLSHV